MSFRGRLPERPPAVNELEDRGIRVPSGRRWATVRMKTCYGPGWINSYLNRSQVRDILQDLRFLGKLVMTVLGGHLTWIYGLDLWEVQRWNRSKCLFCAVVQRTGDPSLRFRMSGCRIGALVFDLTHGKSGVGLGQVIVQCFPLQGRDFSPRFEMTRMVAFTRTSLSRLTEGNDKVGVTFTVQRLPFNDFPIR